MRIGRVLVVAIAATLFGPSTADAATVDVRIATAEVVLVAAVGENNDVVTRETWVPPDQVQQIWTITDNGAVLVPGASCTALGPHVVRCAPPAGSGVALGVRLELGDMDDRLMALDAGATDAVSVDGGPGDDRLVGANFVEGGPGDDELVASEFGFFGGFGDVLDGGPGNDQLVGGAGNDELHGGGGVDDLNGGDGDDRLFDDDSDGAAGDAAPGADRLDGGPGDYDRVSYEQRVGPVQADLAAGTGADGDRLSRVEELVGGRGDDRLAGDNGRNMLDGGRGRDRLSGRGGADELLHAEGPVSCGPGRDSVLAGRSSRDALQPDCEVLMPEEYGSTLSATPLAASRASLQFQLTCPEIYDYDLDYEVVGRCGPGTLSLREVDGSRRTLARGHYPAGKWNGRLVTVRLTPLGRRLASRRRGVWARVRLAGYYSNPELSEYYPRALRWTIRLKAPR